jgi:hypothetical protein
MAYSLYTASLSLLNKSRDSSKLKLGPILHNVTPSGVLFVLLSQGVLLTKPIQLLAPRTALSATLRELRLRTVSNASSRILPRANRNYVVMSWSPRPVVDASASRNGALPAR